VFGDESLQKVIRCSAGVVLREVHSATRMENQ
jgi:hypothetical protein